MTIDFKALGAKAAASGVDMTKAQTGGGGGDYEPPAAGPTRLRFVSYVELGKQKVKSMGKEVVKERVLLTFELSGPKHQPTVNDDGEKIPHRISIEESLSLNEKANFFKLFGRLNYAGSAQHIAQLLGSAYKATVVHRKYAKAGEDKADQTKWTGIAAELKSKADGYTIQPPRYEDPETGDVLPLAVAPAITPIKLFLWNFPDMEQWASIYIDGEYPERKDDKGVVTAKAKSKNVFQNRIKSAVNFQNSPIHVLLAGNGAPLDIPDAEDGRDPDEDEHDVTTDIKGQGKPVVSDDDALNGVV